MINLSVIICTFNPNIVFLKRTIEGLKVQELDSSLWELIIVDNASTNDTIKNIDLSWKSNARIVYQPIPGLTNARFKGSQEANGSWIVFVDDDNILFKNYLQNVLQIISNNPSLGIFGGKAVPDFLGVIPPEWMKRYYGILALKDYGNDILISNYSIKDNKLPEGFLYPNAAPAGAGMCIRKVVFDTYCTLAKNDPIRNNLGRKGKSLASGEDNDIILEIIKQGYQIGYFPQLSLIHIIPSGRMEISYLARLNYAMNISWIQVLSLHHICPWKKVSKWSLPFRKGKAWFTNKAWKGEDYFINWKGACGLFHGLTML
jgi:glycosyltransferase involved in cell wall biosynthesis